MVRMPLASINVCRKGCSLLNFNFIHSDLKALCGPFHTIVRDDTGFEEVVCYHFSTHAFIKSYCLVSLVLLVVQLMKAYMTETSLFYTIDICTTLESC